MNGVQLCVVVVAGMTWEKWLSAHSLFHFSRSLEPTRTPLPGTASAAFTGRLTPRVANHRQMHLMPVDKTQLAV